MKRRRLLSFAMVLAMCISMCMPCLTAYAADLGNTSPADPITCTCTTKCTEGAVADCPVCGAAEADLGKCVGEAVISETECSCGTKCTEGNANSNCPVCSVNGANLTRCKGTEQAPAPESLKAPKAEVNSYESLINAIQSAEDHTETTIQLVGDIKDFDWTIEIPSNKIITLDLNGHDIISTQEYGKFRSAITVKGILNLYDTSQDAKGSHYRKCRHRSSFSW